jgi:L-seryl-tRNA(Ser) seleniumtransferase
MVIDDLGSGCLTDLTPYGIPAEPCVSDSIKAGADLVCFSGDKLLGGPQCGIIVGKRSLVESLERNPLFRAFRVDKMTLLALGATIRLFADAQSARTSVPTLAMLTASTDELAGRANDLAQQLAESVEGERFYVCSDVSYAGGGSLPGAEIPTVVVQWRPSRTSADDMAAELRDAETPVVVRIRDGAICFDLRTVLEPDFDALIGAVAAAVWEKPDEPSPSRVSLPVL